MPLTLAVDTTADYGSIALADERGPREEVLLHAPQGFSRVLFGEIEALLGRQAVQLSDVDLFAAASGPGSFTGLRVGLSGIKGLAEVLGRPAVAVSNLEALAGFGSADIRAAVIDAKRGEVYAAVYDRGGNPIVRETVLPLSSLLALLPHGDIEWISADFEPFRLDLAGTPFEFCPVVAAPRAIAGMIARIAIRRSTAERTTDPAAIDANYVRRSDAERFWKET